MDGNPAIFTFGSHSQINAVLTHSFAHRQKSIEEVHINL